MGKYTVNQPMTKSGRNQNLGTNPSTQASRTRHDGSLITYFSYFFCFSFSSTITVSRWTGFSKQVFCCCFLKSLKWQSKGTIHCHEILKVLFVLGWVNVIAWVPPVAWLSFSPGSTCLAGASAHRVDAWADWQQSHKRISDPRPRSVPLLAEPSCHSLLLSLHSYPLMSWQRVWECWP